MSVEVFPDIGSLSAFKPIADVYSFVTEKKVGVTLLHTHHGHAHLLYLAEFNRSRPIKEEEIATAVPCSWYSNSLGAWQPYEWTTEQDAQLLLQLPPLSHHLAEQLRALSALCGVALGISIRPVRNMTELEDLAEPGAHVFVSHGSVTHADGVTPIVTCVGYSEQDSLSVDICLKETRCVWSNDDQKHYAVNTGGHI